MIFHSSRSQARKKEEGLSSFKFTFQGTICRELFIVLFFCEVFWRIFFFFIKETCNQFQAGSNLRSKNKSKKLDETALFGAGCKHEVPLKFFSLKRGEEYVKKCYVSQGSRPGLLSYDGWILGPLFSEFLWTSHLSWSIRTPKKNLANIKPPC